MSAKGKDAQPDERTIVDYTIEDVKHPKENEVDARKGISISVKNAGVAFSGVHAISNVSFELRAGETLGVIGNNGAGKSTLCDVITGLTRPNSGSVSINDNDVTKKSALARARMGMRRVFQHPVLFSDLSIEENIMIGSPASRGDGLVPSLFVPRLFFKEKRNTARQIMDYCNIELSSTTPIDQLPYGTKKRIELARALMGNPRILILDEPAASMDDDERAHYAQVVSDYVETFSTTLIVVEHDVDFVRTLCKRALVLDAGEVIADGALGDVLKNKDVRHRYYGEEIAT
jgi:branched-chain amino acid transport system ATP-binding protein